MLKNCTHCDFTVQLSCLQLITLARAIQKNLRPRTNYFGKWGKMEAFKGLF